MHERNVTFLCDVSLRLVRIISKASLIARNRSADFAVYLIGKQKRELLALVWVHFQSVRIKVETFKI